MTFSEGRGRKFAPTSEARPGQRRILSGAPSFRCYNSCMHDTPIESVPGTEHDRSLLEWFATLTPEQRLAELESRIGFFLSLRPNNESQF